jgi:hypothetical protein
MISSRRNGESRRRLHGRLVEQPVVAIFAVCLLLFADVPVPLFGDSNRLLGVLILLILCFGGGGRGIRTPFCGTMAVLLPLFFLVPILVHYDVDAGEAAKVLLFQLLSLGGMVLIARALASDYRRRKLIDVLVLFALASAAIAILQRFGVLGPLGRDRWGYSTTDSNDLRGAGFLADPNFLAVLLASIVPLVVSWRFTRLRAPALLILALGLYSTNSRAGILLAVVALTLSIVGSTSATKAAFMAKGRKSVTLVAIGLIVLFALNVDGQRGRAVEAFLIEAGIQTSFGTGNSTDTLVAHQRRNLLESWFGLGAQNLPFGYGFRTKTDLGNAAHNTFATLFGEGGLIGLAIILVILVCFVFLVRRRSEPFAIMGMVVILGGLALSYPGMAFLVLPMGLADGILAAGLGTRARPESESPPTQPERGGLPATKRLEAP